MVAVLADREAEQSDVNRGVAGGLKLHDEAIVDVGGNRDFSAGVDGFVNRNVNELAGAGEIAEVEGGENRDGGVLTSDMVRVPHRRGDRGSIPVAVAVRIVTAYGHDTAHRHLGEVGHLEVAIGAGETERC